jgi:hypothetical protein
MRLRIAAGAHTDHTGRNLPAMTVDGHLLLIDLTGIQGQLWDAHSAIARCSLRTSRRSRLARQCG